VGVGFVARLDDASEEVALEFRAKERGQGPPPTDVTTGFVGECSRQSAGDCRQKAGGRRVVIGNLLLCCYLADQRPRC
jgi:hypothetical protein